MIETANSGFDTAFTNFAGTTTIMANVEQLCCVSSVDVPPLLTFGFGRGIAA